MPTLSLIQKLRTFFSVIRSARRSPRLTTEAAKEQMRAAIDNLVWHITNAEVELAKPTVEELPSPNSFEHDAALNDIFRRHSFHFATETSNFPGLIAGWIMLSLNEETPIGFEVKGLASPQIPIVSGLTADGEQTIQCLVAGKKFVALTNLNMDKVFGVTIRSSDMVEIIRESGLPVWRTLLID